MSDVSPDSTPNNPVDGLSPLHVGLNLCFLEADSGGSATYATGLIRGLLAAEPGTRLTAWVSRSAPAPLGLEDLGGSIDWVRLPFHASRSPGRLSAELLGLGHAASRRGCDVLHGLAYIIPLLSRLPSVVTILDLIWLHHPTAVSLRGRIFLRLLTPLCSRKADRVIAISHATRKELVEQLRVPADKIDVTALAPLPPATSAASPESVRARFGIPERVPILLSVGQIASHKNLAALVDAIELMRNHAVLVLPGRWTGYRNALVARAKALDIEDRVLLPGFVDEAELEGLFAVADVLVAPSVDEGFGLPVLEAMIRTIPVACSDIPVLAETAGGAALLFDPHRPAAIASVLDRLLEDDVLRTRLIEKGRVRAGDLAWIKTAQATLASYRRAIGARDI